VKLNWKVNQEKESRSHCIYLKDLGDSSLGSTLRTLGEDSVWKAGIGCSGGVGCLLLLLCRAARTRVGPPLPPLILRGAIVTSKPEKNASHGCKQKHGQKKFHNGHWLLSLHCFNAILNFLSVMATPLSCLPSD
jgi:hypothetical protein